MSPSWYYRCADGEFGPVSLGELRDLAGRGALVPGDQVRHGSGGPWFSAARVPGLFGAVAATAGSAAGPEALPIGDLPPAPPPVPDGSAAPASPGSSANGPPPVPRSAAIAASRPRRREVTTRRPRRRKSRRRPTPALVAMGVTVVVALAGVVLLVAAQARKSRQEPWAEAPTDLGAEAAFPLSPDARGAYDASPRDRNGTLPAFLNEPYEEEEPFDADPLGDGPGAGQEPTGDWAGGRGVDDPRGDTGHADGPTAGANVPDLTDATFRTEVLEAKGPVMVQFWAPWCGPCRRLLPIVDQIAAANAGRVKVARLNIDDCPATSAAYDIRAVPVVIFFVDGQPKDKIVGLAPYDRLQTAVDQVAAGGRS